MAEEDIVQRVVLDGDKAAIQQLHGIGRAGVTAFRDIQQAASSALGGNPFRGLQNAIITTTQRFGSIVTSARQFGQSVSAVGERIAGTTTRIATFTAGIGLANAGVVALARNIAKTAGDIQDAAQMLGLSTKRYQELAFAANQAGLSQEQFTTGISFFQRAVANETQGQKAFTDQVRDLNRAFSAGGITSSEYNRQLQDINEKARQSDSVFTRLGVTIRRNAAGEADLTAAFDDTINALNNTSDQTLRLASSRELFGRGGGKFVNAIEGGTEGLRRQAEESQRLGLVIDDLAINRVAKLDDAFDRLALANRSTAVNLLAVFQPQLLPLLDAFVEAMARWREQAVQFARTLAAQLLPLTDDLIALLQGRRGDIRSELFKSLITDAERAAAAVGFALRLIRDSVLGLVAALDLVATAWNKAFGTNITGTQILVVAATLKLLGVFRLLGAVLGTVGPAVRLVVAGFGTLASLFGVVATSAAVLVQGLAGVAGFLVRLAAGAGVFNLLTTGILTVVRVLGTLALAFSGPMLAIVALGVAIGALVVLVILNFNRIRDAITQSLATAFQFFSNTAASALAFVQQKVTELATFLTGIFGPAIEAVIGFFQTLPAAVTAVFNQIPAIAQAAWDLVLQAVSSLGTTITNIFTSVLSTITGLFSTAVDNILGFFDNIIQRALSVADAIRNAFRASQQAQSGDSLQSRASGGPVRGPGGPRSDRVLLWGSNGEFMIQAAAVRHYGEGLMQMINSMRWNPQGLATGGLVSAPARPRIRYADGGTINAGAGVLNLTIDRETFEGMRVPADTFAELSKYAATKSSRSAGHKPTWHRG